MSRPIDRVLIIAEAGVNHNGSLELALRLVDLAAEAGADLVKFQTFKAELCVSESAPKAQYQVQTTGAQQSQLEMVKKLELDAAAHELLIERCRLRGIGFLSTPFDLESVDLLAGRFDLPLIKIPSGEITNAPLLLKIARTGKEVLLSTGMSTLGEIETALGILAFGYLGETCVPSREAFARAFCSDAGQALVRERVRLLHCTTEYPAPPAEVNLRAMDTMAAAFGLPVGFSDHTEGIAVALAAVARGAVVLEKHFTLDRTLPGPDHRASIEPGELQLLVQSVRTVESALGSPLKCPSPCEQGNLAVARKSLVAAVGLEAGAVLTEQNLGVKRPGTGVSPLEYWDYLGRRTERCYRKDEPIQPDRRSNA